MTKRTTRMKMDEPQVSKLILDIISEDDPKKKKKLKEFNQPAKKSEGKLSKKKK